MHDLDDLAGFGVQLVDPLPAAAIASNVATFGRQVTSVHDLDAKRAGQMLDRTDYILLGRATAYLTNGGSDGADCLAF